MTPSSCPWRTRARGPNSAGSPASGRCTSSAEPGSRWPTRTSSPGCATRTWRMMRMQPKPLRSRMGESASGQGQGFRPNVHPQLPVVLQHHQQQHPAILPCLLQLDATPFDPEEPPGSAGLLPTPAAGAGADPDRRGTGGGPLARCLQRHLLRARLPAVGPGSLPRDLHLLRRQGPPGLPVLLLALFREVSRGRTAGIQPRLRAAPGGAPRPRPALVSSSQGKDCRTLEPPAPSKFAQEVCPLPRPGKLVPCLFCALTYSRAWGLLRCCFVLIKECTSLQERP
ncbi:transmembrane protein 134 isoform X1 [Panthera uncia]|uniref:transmembrane protein 134 isoform X1 n=1 Tax=Panthera uncia TaxID=29064 RepID=UPI0020FFA326|nr:transmembrane protein 134 isoform X1 [Panthera uncia]